MNKSFWYNKFILTEEGDWPIIFKIGENIGAFVDGYAPKAGDLCNGHEEYKLSIEGPDRENIAHWWSEGKWEDVVCTGPVSRGETNLSYPGLLCFCQNVADRLCENAQVRAQRLSEIFDDKTKSYEEKLDAMRAVGIKPLS